MMVVLLLSVAAAISVGYLSVVAEAGVRKLHEVQVVRRVVEAVFLFPLIEAFTAHEGLKIRGISLARLFDWSSGFRWVAVAVAVAGVTWWLTLSVLDNSLDLLLYIIFVIVVVLFFLERTIGRPKSG
jgi:hypothetical protein